MPYLYRDILIKKDLETNKDRYVNVVYPDIEFRDDDSYVITTSGDRLDLLAHQFYNDPNLWWVINNANPDTTRGDSIVVKRGVQLRVPSANSISGLLRSFEKINNRR
jgi:nucleoid-associated protein YgaU|tara:strand:+ start:1097 stop:1417 length:321 start_codon:yes stop_codon:yes gene_type:complete